MKNIMKLLYMFLLCLKRVFKDLSLLNKGQKKSYELIQLSHRLEKGLLIRKPKSLWGWDKAYRVYELLKHNDDSFSKDTASAVLSAFIERKTKSDFSEDRDKLSEFLHRTNFTPNNNDKGGVCLQRKPSFSSEEKILFETLFNSRHSVREFSDLDIPNDIILKAVELSLRCPSACNRQPFKVYAIETSLMEQKYGIHYQCKAPKSLIITGDIRAFGIDEILDWMISPSIFVGYLTLALHSLGIGSCVFRKDLVKSSNYNNIIRKATNMEPSECVILEILIGYYKESYMVPISNRKKASDIVSFL